MYKRGVFFFENLRWLLLRVSFSQEEVCLLDFHHQMMTVCSGV